ncbi:trehalase-like isoform X4 [Mauremys reevesii]|uniref:trehalase-like isoform X4 n=1 Tax=Mauremys reevesii TaxID=260615 RepID=UPI00193EC7C2|nr:trehalase-like isoform X4 [Mauremys reevesii]
MTERDSYWVIEGLLLSEMAATAKGMIQNFLYLVERYGHIPNGGRVYYLRRSQPPFLTLMMDAYLAHANDTDFLRENIHLLEVEYEFWQRNRSVSITVGDRNHTLNYYNVQIGEPRPESYSKDWELASDLNEDARQELWAELKSAAESGLDFSSRWFLSWPSSLPATLKDTKARAVVPVDLNAFLCKTEHLLASFYRILGNTTKAAQFQAALRRRLEAVQAVFWNEAAGVWLDFNLLKKQPNPAFFPSNLARLWTDCFSDQAAAERAVRYLEIPSVAFCLLDGDSLGSPMPPFKMLSTFAGEHSAVLQERAPYLTFQDWPGPAQCLASTAAYGDCSTTWMEMGSQGQEESTKSRRDLAGPMV